MTQTAPTAAVTDLHRTIAERYGTPAYVYDLAEVRQAHGELAAMLPGQSILYYSVKANPHPAVCRQLAMLGCGAEVSSAGEIETAVAAGFPPGRCLLTGPAKSPAEIALAIQHGIRDFSVESPADLRRVSAAAAAAGTPVNCLLRVNADTRVPGMGLSMTGVASQFGVDAGWVREHPGEFAAGEWATIGGLHLFMGSNLDGEDVLARQFDVAMATAAGIEQALARPLPILDLGGGFAAPYARPGTRPRYPNLRAHLAGLAGRGQRRQLAFESGRFLVGGCGTLLARVADVKKSKGVTYAVLDSGINHLGGMSGLRRVPPVRVGLACGGPAGEDVPGCHVVGPLCTPLDGWARGVTLPRLRPGDLVTVPNVGGYGLTASLLAFLSRPAAVEVAVDAGEILAADRLVLTRRPVPPTSSPPPTAPEAPRA